MTMKAKQGGYSRAALRVEWRPQTGIHSRDELQSALDEMEKAGVDGWWYSVCAPGGIPLFQSRVLPAGDLARPENADTYRWLARECKRRGIALLSHQCMLACPPLALQNPEWRVRFLTGSDEETNSPRDEHVLCLASPYGEKLKAFAVEIVCDLEFDGVWFDCTGFIGFGGRWLCVCDRCAALFTQATSWPAPPVRLDFNDPVFRDWIKWRYDFVQNYWAELTAYVHARKPDAVLALNFANRLNRSAERAYGLRRWFGVPALFSTEVDWRPNQILLQMKYLRAVAGENAHDLPPESWLGLTDAAALWQPSRPEPDQSGLVYFGLACMTGGGFASFGGEPHPTAMRRTLRTMGQAFHPVAPFVGGVPLRHIGLVVSGATLDFGHRVGSEKHHGWEREPWRGSLASWQAVHGMHYLLNGLHLPSEVLLDDELTDAGLAPYKVIVLSDVRCMSQQAADALTRWVENGGLLLATGETGRRDENGLPYPDSTGVLDDLLGVGKVICDEAASLIVSDLAILLQNENTLPASFLLSGKGRLVVPADSGDTEVLAPAHAAYPHYRWEGAGRAANPPPPTLPGAAAILRTLCGKGQTIYLAPDIGGGYAVSPNRRSRLLLRGLLELASSPQPPFLVDAPPHVAVTAWIQETESGPRLVFHLLNQPLSSCVLTDANDPTQPEDFPAVGPIQIRVPRQVSSVYAAAVWPADAPAQMTTTPWQANGGVRGVEIRLESLGLHMVLVCKET